MASCRSAEMAVMEDATGGGVGDGKIVRYFGSADEHSRFARKHNFHNATCREGVMNPGGTE